MNRGARLGLAALTATPFVYIPGVLYPASVPRAIFFRALVGAVSFLLVIGWARGDRSPEFSALRRDSVARGLAFYAVTVALTAAIGASPAVGLLGEMIRMHGAVAWLGFLLFYCLLRIVLDAESWRPFLRLVVLVGAVVAVWSLVQAYGEAFGVALVGWGETRVVGTLGLEGPLAIYMLLVAAMAGYLAFGAATRLRRAVWCLSAALALWVVVLTGTRSAMVAVALSVTGTAGWVAATSSRGQPHRRLALQTFAGLGVALVGLLVLGRYAVPSLGRLLDIGLGALDSRLHLWRSAWIGFLEHPLFGVGPAGFELLYDQHFRAPDYLLSGAAHHDRAHNVILGVMAESGGVGLVAYLLFWGGAAVTCRSALRRAGQDPGLMWLVVGVGAHFVYLLLWFEDLASFHVLLIVLAFLEHQRLRGDGTVSSSSRDRHSRSETTGPGAVSRWTAAGLLAVALGGLGWYHFQVVRAAQETRQALSASSPVEVFRHFDRALERPLASTREITSRYVGALRGFVALEAQGRVSADSDLVNETFRDAERAVQIELARHPTYSAVHIRLARLQRARWRWSGQDDDFRAAVESYRRVLDESPERVRYLHELARLHTLNGDPNRAMALLNRSLEELPGWWETYNTMAQVQWDAGNREKAVEYLLQAARTEVRFKASGTGTQFMVRAGSWLEARGTPMEAVELYEAYLGNRFPGWESGESRATGTVPGDALPIAARLPITLMDAGRIEEAGRAARRLRARLPAHLRRPVVTDRLDRFVADMEAGRTEPWREAWGVLPTDVPLGG